VVARIVARTGLAVRELMGNTSVLRAVRPEELVDGQFGLPTVKDILAELEKPGRDPRPDFRTASFKDGIEHISDLTPGMQLEGVVTNVANFGAFVDIGVHQDGLVHVSQLADRFVKDPREVVKAGDIVTVKVVAVDLKRQRIALTMKLREAAVPAASVSRAAAPRPPERPAPKAPAPATSIAAAFSKLRSPRG